MNEKDLYRNGLETKTISDYVLEEKRKDIKLMERERDEKYGDRMLAFIFSAFGITLIALICIVFFGRELNKLF